jgi:hypothetical protein
MKILHALLAFLFLGFPIYVYSQDAKADPAETSAEAAEAAAEAKEIPTEVSEPPYEVGDLVTVSGYYIDRGEDLPRINIRIVDNKFRLYWIDKDGLIAEPEYNKASIRLTGSVRGRPYHYLTTLPEGAGLGSNIIAPPPHIYNLQLALVPSDESKDPPVYRIRYTALMDAETDPIIEPSE